MTGDFGESTRSGDVRRARLWLIGRVQSNKEARKGNWPCFDIL